MKHFIEVTMLVPIDISTYSEERIEQRILVNTNKIISVVAGNNRIGSMMILEMHDDPVCLKESYEDVRAKIKAAQE